ncbi:hypothetical protein [Pseudomonas sp. Irchel 3H3]|uniref:hypothetical protein n=1 Tax=Pseudomonas sp. Irchel 3H3 TaxID=2009038 RepID=UPI000BA37E33|nr:hypothetical protein [Pseudomonas sp. Irchel 3H3]
MEPFTPLTIRTYLTHLGDPSISSLESMQARQMLGYLTSVDVHRALSATAPDSIGQWTDGSVLPLLLNLKATRLIAARATGRALDTIGPEWMLEFMYQLASTIWRDFADRAAYPDSLPDSEARSQFRASFFARALEHNHNAYVLHNDQISLLASIVDARHVRGLQRQQIGRMLGNRFEQIGLFAQQPSAQATLIKGLTELIGEVAPTLDPATIYSMRVHAAEEDDPALIMLDPVTQRPAVALSYNQPVAQLITEMLRANTTPPEGRECKTLWISLYQDLHVQQQDGPSSPVSSADLLREAPVNYSNFKLHAFLPVSRTLFDGLLEFLRNWTARWLDDLKHYWDTPSPGIPRKQAWGSQLTARLQDAARLGVLDGTLETAHYQFLFRTLQDPTTACIHTLALQDRASFRTCVLNRCFLITPALADAPDFEQLQGPIICVTPTRGLQVFTGWTALNRDVTEQLAQAPGAGPLLGCLTRHDALHLASALRDSIERVSLHAYPLASDLVGELIDATLAMQDKNLNFAVETGKGSVLDQGLLAFLGHLDAALETSRVQDLAPWVAERNLRLVEKIADQQLFNAWTAHRNEAGRDGNALALTFFDMPPLRTGALTDAERRQLMLEALASPQTIERVGQVLNRTPYYFAQGAITPALAFRVIEKIYRYQLHRLNAQWEVPDSRGYKCFVMEQLLARDATREQARHTADLVTPGLLGLNPAASERLDLSYSATVLDEAQARIRAGSFRIDSIIGARSTPADVDALCDYLQVSLVYPAATAPSHTDPYLLTHGLFLDLLCDFPGFHRLERAMDPRHLQSPPLRRAMALEALTNYLEPVASRSLGHVCGLNLLTVALGERTHEQVRLHLRQHLQATFKQSSARGAGALTFTLLCREHAPELLVRNVPDSLLFGQSLSAIQFRHAVNLAEQLRPGSSLIHRYQELMSFYSQCPFEQLPEPAQLAIAVSGQVATLHFAMCRGVIAQTSADQVGPDQSLAALLHLQQQQMLEARTFTQLAQVPPVRKSMALERLKSQPELNLQRRSSFTESQVLRFFVKGYHELGRSMRMTALERYMTCGVERAFGVSELGFIPDIDGGCALQAAFEERYQDFKQNYLQGQVERMVLALHDLPALDRDRILGAYKFIKVSFKDPQGQRQTACHGLIALYKKDDQEYAYEIFSASGTIRLLGRNGTRRIRVNYRFSPPTADAIYHESPYMSAVPDLDQDAYLQGRPGKVLAEPELDVGFYTVARQISALDRDGKIRFLSQKMVDEVFGKAVDQAYDVLREPTPYERYRESLLASNERLASFFVPGYSVYLDISRGTVTPGTFLFAGLEVLSYLVPFGNAVLHAVRAYVQVGRLVVRSTSFGISRLALKAAQTAQGAREFSAVLAKGFAQAANPLGPAIFLFQGGIKGVALVRAGSRFVRGQLHASQLANGLNLPPLGAASGDLLRSQDLTTLAAFRQADALAFFKPNLSVTRNALTIPQQRQLVAHGIDLSDVPPVMNLYTINRHTYILMQGHPYAVSPLPDTTQWRVHSAEVQGPVVTFNASRQVWEVTC